MREGGRVRDLATDLLDLLALLILAAGIGLVVDAAVIRSRPVAGVGAGLVATGLAVLAGSLLAHYRGREGGTRP
jgi:putative effector of murein hydrolase LrgA (UPF0299 family)